MEERKILKHGTLFSLSRYIFSEKYNFRFQGTERELSLTESRGIVNFTFYFADKLRCFINKINYFL